MSRPIRPASALLLLAVLPLLARAHSLLGQPLPMSARPCRLGGIPATGGLMTCPGPCDVNSLQPGFPVVTSPTQPSATYKRGERITVKYQRNNHGPGGFIRHTLVPLSKMMDKKSHARNAFHYACWGAHAVVATRKELGRDKQGFSLVGGDRKLHDGRIGSYEAYLTIPPVVPDGKYVLGWVWYGGVGGSMKTNNIKHPHHTGLFADYWSCSFVEIKGGSPLEATYTPVFKTGLSGRWAEECNSMNDKPGVCKYEPCTPAATFQKPLEFKNGAVPPPLTPDHFVSGEGPFLMPTPVPDSETLVDVIKELETCESKLTRPLPNTRRDRLQNALVALYQCRKLSQKEDMGVEEKLLFDEIDEPMPSPGEISLSMDDIM